MEGSMNERAWQGGWGQAQLLMGGDNGNTRTGWSLKLSVEFTVKRAAQLDGEERQAPTAVCE
jgi:hypothetical protein